MTLNVALHHRTAYRYDRPVTLGPQIVRLRPAPHARTPILSYALKIRPEQHFINWQQDPFGNWLARLVFPEPTREFVIDVDLVADMAVVNPFDFFLEASAEKWPFAYDPSVADELAPYFALAEGGARLDAWVASIARTPRPTADFLVELNVRLQHEIAYIVRMEPGVQAPEETLALAKGSCRDSGWLLVQILRRLGFAARFVSGYLIQLVADQKPLDGPAGTSVDFTDLHAWCEVYLPGAGWIGLDPTSGLLTGEGHIPLAATPAPSSAAPIEGAVSKAEVEFGFEMKVTRIAESARVTKPFDEAAWARIDALGRAVDAKLAASDVRLTMGGEPTFVAIDDPDGAEWNTTALGPTKRRYAAQLLKRLAPLWASGHLLHFGQGKWYPGELLPRWAFGCWWRRDGEPIWRDPALFADDETKDGADYERARRFGTALAERLQIDPASLIPGYEDVWYLLWKERTLPVNVDPLKSRLADPEERKRLRKLFERGLDAPVGLALPIRRVEDGGRARWTSGPWFLRDQHMFLLPGDSPMGLRLPLDSLPWVAPEDYPYVVPPDPFEARPPLPPHQSFRLVAARPPGRAGVAPQGDPAAQRAIDRARLKPHVSADWIVRTALCFEPRDGRLHVFMPPVAACEDYLDLCAAIEDTAAELGQRVTIEGYAPPRDVRLNHFSVTPDPGVIEVNVQPSTSWDELATRTTTLYEEARACRLGSEKFMIDGRHVGTGGGNHMVMGAAAPADSPFLRRPALLRSLVGYWINHPSLSYLFSGLFIGPTSQHPRVDEARGDALRELAIAFDQVPDDGEVAPWTVDRIFRNLLVDVTGNTHRTEFCIDKLYAPESATGRLGLVELRAFEMPPHARMSLVQQVLLRALVARFWERPYRAELIRWDTRLHDRFMLPHFVAEDLGDVVADLAAEGFAFERGWFEPHLEFRFPKLGAIAPRGVALELRHALEPWHVLGEEPAAGGTVRFVDSSVERLQVKVANFEPERFVVACNGRRVPLHPTGTRGEFVAGVRFKAWGPSAALHPTIGVHAPLTFDLVDSWSGRSVGGCSYHVAHPGGRNYETFPVNANEAEARRRARFFATGHTPGPLAPAPEIRDRDLPLTLDLRAPPPA